MKRRKFLLAAGSVCFALPVTQAHSEVNTKALDLHQDLVSSALIYLSPVQRDGSLSRCQAEVWFQWYQGHIYVVTGSDAWRAKAIQRGVTRTKVWVGDVGQWRRSNGAYLKLPSVEMSGELATDPEEHATVLRAMGAKYSSEWNTWGPRFRDGLADGSRVMLRYSA